MDKLYFCVVFHNIITFKWIFLVKKKGCRGLKRKREKAHITVENKGYLKLRNFINYIIQLFLIFYKQIKIFYFFLKTWEFPFVNTKNKLFIGYFLK